MLDHRLRSVVSPRSLAFSVLMFVCVTVLTKMGAFASVDPLLTAVRLHLQVGLIDGLSLLLGVAGSVEVTSLLVVVLAARIWRTNQRLAIAIVVAFVAGNLVEAGLKATLVHPNPPILRPLGASALPAGRILQFLAGVSASILPSAIRQNSYPSGHMLRCLMLGLVIVIQRPTSLVRGVVLAFWVLLATGLMLGGAHWPSDVLGGTLLGWACAAAAFSVDRRDSGLHEARSAAVVEHGPPPTISRPAEEEQYASYLRELGTHRHGDHRSAGGA
jgi:undecaprenyl-diphosphatase